MWSWPLTLNSCSVSHVTQRNCTKFEWNRTIYGRVIAIWISDLMILNMCHTFCYVCSGIICTKFKLSQLIRLWNALCNDFLMLICYVTLWPWPLMPWPWKRVVGQCHDIKLCTKFDWDQSTRSWVTNNLANVFRGGRTFKLYSSEGSTELHQTNCGRTEVCTQCSRAITCSGYDCSCDDVHESEILTAIYFTRTTTFQYTHFIHFIQATTVHLTTLHRIHPQTGTYNHWSVL